MARVTVEDCVDKVENRFELVLLSAQRARSISAGSQLTIDRDNDKNPVVALREIADQTVSPDDLREDLISGMQRHVEVDEPEAEDAPMLIGRDDTSGDTMTEEDLLRALRHELENPTEPPSRKSAGMDDNGEY